jgi:hypothetical protein
MKARLIPTARGGNMDGTSHADSPERPTLLRKQADNQDKKEPHDEGGRDEEQCVGLARSRRVVSEDEHEESCEAKPNVKYKRPASHPGHHSGIGLRSSSSIRYATGDVADLGPARSTRGSDLALRQ